MIVVTLARKPLMSTVAGNALKHGTGGLNIDRSRIGTTDDFSEIKSRASMKLNSSGKTHDPNCESVLEAQRKLQTLGRWPANLILCHLEGCVCVGTKKIKGNPHLGQVNPDRVVQYGGGVFGGGLVTPVSGFAGKDGKETVPDWVCVEGCPVKGLDEQSGVVATGTWNRQTDTAHPFGNAKGAEYQTWQAPKEAPGGASRYFKIVGGRL